MDSTGLEDTLGRIAELAKLVYSKEAFWKVSEMQLMPAATPDAIDRLNRSCPFPLPPSYVSFLRLHDGCLNFWPKFALLGTKGEPFEIVRAEVEDARQHQSQFAADAGGQVTPESSARFEASGGVRSLLFLPNHDVFGTNRGGEFFVFNERVVTQGESEVIHYTYSGGAYARYPSFPLFLIATVEELEKRIDQKRYKKRRRG
jgi:hypothetical protein